MFRADLAVFESCRTAWTPAEQVDVPVLACWGTRDAAVPEADSRAWRRWTTGAFLARGFAGDHFFPLAQGAPLLAEIRDILGG